MIIKKGNRKQKSTGGIVYRGGGGVSDGSGRWGWGEYETVERKGKERETQTEKQDR